ncbi:uncharacterized protein LOC130695083 [Daphnia carinata]|uniref:uncharacterized protein LOC130695083 n=1 Tax=Daphnia carinata TaxID=120202 RepID=UPI00257BAC27|nr:uncharacterized protein LOC130695083 [Daphnia carinata]
MEVTSKKSTRLTVVLLALAWISSINLATVATAEDTDDVSTSNSSLMREAASNPTAEDNSFGRSAAAYSSALSEGSSSVAQEAGSSWTKLQISPLALGSMPYGTFRINIYEHSANLLASTPESRKRYYYAPIALLEHISVFSLFNNVTGVPELRFRVQLWHDEIEKKITTYTAKLLQRKVLQEQVEVIPFNKVILVTTSPSKDYWPSNEWIPYQFHQSIEFQLTCNEMIKCQQLEKNMRVNPYQFSHLKLLFSLDSQTTQRRETVIRVESILSGEMMSTLNQRYPNKPDALLTAQDEKRLLTESATNVIVDSFDDSEVITSTSETQIYSMLKDMLISARTTIKDQGDEMWESVFWNEDNYRPDKATKTWNEIYNKLDTETQRHLKEEFSDSNSFSLSNEVRLRIVKVATSVSASWSSSGLTESEAIDKFYQETKNSVQWEGEQFKPKQMDLSRVNLNDLRDSQNYQDRSVRVSYSMAVLSIGINFAEYSDAQSNSIIFQLQKQVDDLKTSLNVTSTSLKTSQDVLASRITANQNRLTSLETKKPGVYFNVYRNSSFNVQNAFIPFQAARLNIGNAMNIGTGVFRAPEAGIYAFYFNGIKYKPSDGVLTNQNGATTIAFYLNEQSIGRSEAGHSAEEGTLSYSTIVELKAGDQVKLKLVQGILHDSVVYHTRFSGALLKGN